MIVEALNCISKSCPQFTVCDKASTEVFLNSSGKVSLFFVFASADRPVKSTERLYKTITRMVGDFGDVGVAFSSVVRRGVKRAKSKVRDEDAMHCFGYLLQDIMKVNPQYVVLLGQEVANVFGVFKSIKEVHGQVYEVQCKKLTDTDSQKVVLKIVPTYSSQEVLRSKIKQEVLEQDLLVTYNGVKYA